MAVPSGEVTNLEKAPQQAVIPYLGTIYNFS
jgi:hypothetical protein